MDTNRLRYFLTVAKTGSLREAADAHRVSSPAISKAMRLLQSEVRRELIVADGRGIRVTPAGMEFAREVEPILKLLEHSVAGEADRSPAAILKIGSFEVFTTHFIGEVFQDSFGDRAIQVHEFIPGKLEEAVAKGVIDFGLTYIPIPTAGVVSEKVAAIEMGVFSRVGKFKDILPEKTPFAVPLSPIEGNPNRVRGLDGWPEDEFPRYAKFQVSVLETALELCRRGLAVIYIPAFLAKLHNQTVKPEFRLESRPIPFKRQARPTTEVYLLRRKSQSEDRDYKVLAKYLRVLTKAE